MSAQQQQVVETEEQKAARTLKEAMTLIQSQAWHMKRAFDQDNLIGGLACAGNMISKLKESDLTPQSYYEIYLAVTEELRDVEQHFFHLDQQDQAGDGGKSVMELYESVQHAGNILPRLYLLITVASVYIRSKRAPAKDVLFDLVELCRGVQHPMRGLFLRSYLSEIAKDKLPDIGSEYNGEGGSVSDAVDFLLLNFAEMNKLWVRMQHQGAVRDRAKREKERKNLKQLVGTNLNRLSSLQGVDLALYSEKETGVLPRVLEQIVNCKDVIAQEYLMECLIRVFPDDFHLHTLAEFLTACGQLQEKVNVKDIVIMLMNRLAAYVQQHRDSTGTVGTGMFDLFHQHSSQIINGNEKMPLSDVLALQVALFNFVTSVYPDRLDYLDSILSFSTDLLKKLEKNGQLTNYSTDQKCINAVVDLLTLPLQALGLNILKLSCYQPLMAFLEVSQRKQVSMTIVQSLLKTNAKLDDLGKVDALFNIIMCLVQDEAKPGEAKESTREDISESDLFELDQEQTLMAKLINNIQSPDVDTHFKMMLLVRKYCGFGGTIRIEYTLPTNVYNFLQLAERAYVNEERAANAAAVVAATAAATTGDGEEPVTPKEVFTAGKIKAKKIFQTVHETIVALTRDYPELALRLLVQAAYVADKCKYESIAYEFVAQAFICYENEIAKSKAQLNAINYLVAALVNFTSFNKENYETLASKCTMHSNRLLTDVSKSRAVYNCAHLFWPSDPMHVGRDDKRVLVCLQKALKLADASGMNNDVHLFVEILNKYLYFYEKGCPSIVVKDIKKLIDLIYEHVSGIDPNSSSAALMLTATHFRNTLSGIMLKQTQDDDNETKMRYAAIEIVLEIKNRMQHIMEIVAKK